MGRSVWMVLVCLLTTVLVLSSCAKNGTEVPPIAETETTQNATPTTPSKPELQPASFSISGLTITPMEVTTGSPVIVEVLVTNSGELSGTYNVTLKIDDTVEATEKVTLAGGASQKVTFTKTKTTAKTYSLSVNGQSGTFVVKAPPPSPSIPTQTLPLPAMSAFQKGIAFAAWLPFDAPRYGLYTPPGADQSLKNLATTGANWISLVVCCGQETRASTTIFRTQPRTATDSELLHVITLAHSLGMRVMLKPQLDFSNDPTHWRGHIGTVFTSEAQWQDWFTSYQGFINYYATFAQRAGVDMLCIGVELGGTTHREGNWRRIVQDVRQQYKGAITYASLCSSGSGLPHGEEERITWWDAVDYIGVDVYYTLTDKNAPTVEELKEAWTKRGHIALLENLSSRFNKPIIFTEFGYESSDGTNKCPGCWNTGAPIDLQEQADCYQAALEVLWGKPWLAGIYWWQWRAEPGLGGPNDISHNPYGKPAAEILKRFYLAEP